jgi:proteasome assembly chaperone (PAC2) family protein
MGRITTLRKMDYVHRTSRPQLRRPQAILAWEGWNDACDAASGAVAYLLGQRDDPEPFAWIEPEEFYDFQVRRPHVEVDDGGTRSLSWPLTSAFAIETDTPHDLVVTLGEEPNLKWKTYTRSVARLLAESDVEMVVTLGAFIGQVAHTAPVPIVGVATDPALVERHNLQTSRYQGPTGIVGVMLEACREIGIPAVSLWGAAPHYLAANPNPKVMLALLSTAREVLDVEIDTTELEMAVEEFQTKVDEAMAENDDFTGYVKRLEAQSPDMSSIDPGTGGALIDEIEDFLRDR